MADTYVYHVAHHSWECRFTGCQHCSRCGLGPQYSLTFTGTGSGLCPQCVQDEMAASRKVGP